jgi:DNA mismatch endonuclease (patch repair protein)
MADVHTKEQRSRNMAAIRSRGNKKTELVLVDLFRNNKITGWRRQYKRLHGTPDFVFLQSRIVIFVDGCFWHGCHYCNLRSKSNKNFWGQKIKNNKARDRKVNILLKKSGWKVLRFWEHEIKKKPEKVIAKIKKAPRSHPGRD